MRNIWQLADVIPVSMDWALSLCSCKPEAIITAVFTPFNKSLVRRPTAGNISDSVPPSIFSSNLSLLHSSCSPEKCWHFPQPHLLFSLPLGVSSPHYLLLFLSVLACILLLSFSGCFITPLVFLVETDPTHSCTRLSCRHWLRTALGFPAQPSDHSTSHIRTVSLLLSTCSICCSHKVKKEWGKVNEEAQRVAVSFLLNFRLIWSQNSHLLGSLHIEKSRTHNIELFRYHIFV